MCVEREELQGQMLIIEGKQLTKQTNTNGEDT